MNEAMNGKTKKVGGFDLSQHCFAYVGDPNDTNSWKFPIHFPSGAGPTINHIKNSLQRWDETKGIPASEKEKVWHTIAGAARAHGLRFQDRTFPVSECLEAQRQEIEKQRSEIEQLRRDLQVKAVEIEGLRQTKLELTAVQIALKLNRDYNEVAAMVADADRRADATLKSLGLQ